MENLAIFQKTPFLEILRVFLAKSLRRYYPIDTKITQDDLWLIKILDTEGRHQSPTGSARTCTVKDQKRSLSWLLNDVEISKVNRNVCNGHMYIDVMKQHIPKNA